MRSQYPDNMVKVEEMATEVFPKARGESSGRERISSCVGGRG